MTWIEVPRRERVIGGGTACGVVTIKSEDVSRIEPGEWDSARQDHYAILAGANLWIPTSWWYKEAAARLDSLTKPSEVS